MEVENFGINLLALEGEHFYKQGIHKVKVSHACYNYMRRGIGKGPC